MVSDWEKWPGRVKHIPSSFILVTSEPAMPGDLNNWESPLRLWSERKNAKMGREFFPTALF
jgi:hypothetical protein